MKILIIDDEKSQREILADILSDAGFEVGVAESGEKGLEQIFGDGYYLVLTDLKMPGKNGQEVLKEALAFNPDIQVVMMTAFGTIPGAVNAIKNGAYDYLTKPFQKEELLRVIGRAAEKARLLEENRRLRNEISQRYSYQNILGASKKMQQIFRLIERIKDIDATVLISGESGTGKELVARAIHYGGIRKDGPFVAINCGAIPENLIESELFGHEKGAFTGASKSHPGKFEQAHTGTIFLDEIGAMPPSLQVRLLRVLQEKKVERVGGTDSVDLDVRVIAATNEDLNDRIENNQFRLDLYHRLNVFSLRIPPLRDRREDIPLLARHFLQKFCTRYGKPSVRLSPEALHCLENYDYPGNVRELENIIEKTVIMTDEEVISPDLLMLPERNPRTPQSAGGKTTLPDLELKMLTDALKSSRGSIKKAAEILGITYKTLQYRMNKHGLHKDDYKI